MDSQRNMKRATRMTMLGMKALPNQPNVFAAQSQIGTSFADIQALDVSPIAPIQNAQGQIQFMLDVDGL
jgi:hypothetical protein